MISQIDLVLSQPFDDWFEIMINQEGVRLIGEEYFADLTDDKVKELNDVLTKYLEEREKEKNENAEERKNRRKEDD